MRDIQRFYLLLMMVLLAKKKYGNLQPTRTLKIIKATHDLMLKESGNIGGNNDRGSNH